MINRKTFFAYARRAPFGGSLSTAQVAGMAAVIDRWERLRLTDLRWLAYMLATAFHETQAAMQPVRENMNYTTAAQIRKTWPTRFPTIASAEPYERQPRKLANFVYGGRLGNVGPDDGWIYRGDGLPQLTGKAHFAKFGVAPGMDLPTSVRVMFDGMIGGLYTGQKLSQYFSAMADDPVRARAIVNGSDKAKLIASYHRAFLDALNAADTDTPQPADVTAAEAEPDDVPPAQSKGLWATVATFLTGTTSLPFLGNVSNGYALGGLALILLAGGIAAWLVLSGRITINRVKALA